MSSIWPNTTASNPFFYSPRDHRIWDPNTMESRTIVFAVFGLMCRRVPLKVRSYQPAKLSPANVELPPKQRELSWAYITLSIYTTRRLISWRRTTTMNPLRGALAVALVVFLTYEKRRLARACWRTWRRRREKRTKMTMVAALSVLDKSTHDRVALGCRSSL